MRSVWVDAGNDPDFATLDKHDISCPYFDARWLAAKAKPLEYLQGVRRSAPCNNVGIFLCDPRQWPTSGAPTEPKAWADWAYELVQKKIAPGTSGDFPRVHLNYEQDDPFWLLTMLKRWRWHSPRRTTGWSVQCHKASIYADIVKDLLPLNVTICPQCYVGSPVKRVESQAEVQAWATVGVPPERLSCFLLADSLGEWWQGTAFTQGSLPQ